MAVKMVNSNRTSNTKYFFSGMRSTKNSFPGIWRYTKYWAALFYLLFYMQILTKFLQSQQFLSDLKTLKFACLKSEILRLV